jgi:hypothetical protein
MTKYYTSVRVTVELHRKIIRAKGRFEANTGDFYSMEKVLNKALDALLSQ